MDGSYSLIASARQSKDFKRHTHDTNWNE